MNRIRLRLLSFVRGPYIHTVRLGSRCRSVFKTREFRFDYLTNMIDGIEKMSFVYWHFLASRILAEISSGLNLINFGPNQ